jgi:sulfite exporter TauE/SafE
MDHNQLFALTGTAAFVGLTHTLMGPDHYIPFVAMSKAGRWSSTKTLIITVLCGIGHVGSSVVLGIVGIGLGAALQKLEWVEGFRGNIAGWLLLGFGLAYMAWGVRRAIRNQPHTHLHVHADGTAHAHEHVHAHNHAHVHTEPSSPNMTPWILFTIFVFGPCEPLIPLIMYPAAKHSTLGVVLVTLVFGLVTIATMTTLVMAATRGLTRLSLPAMERYSHAAAGFAIAACGAAVTMGL